MKWTYPSLPFLHTGLTWAGDERIGSVVDPLCLLLQELEKGLQVLVAQRVGTVQRADLREEKLDYICRLSLIFFLHYFYNMIDPSEWFEKKELLD